MGANVSQRVEGAVTAAINVANTSTQNCAQRATQEARLNVNCPGCNVNVSGINFSNFAVFRQECVEGFTVTNEISQVISQAFQQEAMAIAQQFQLSAANADQVARIAAGATVNITNAAVQQCKQRLLQESTLNITCSAPSAAQPCVANVTNINFNNAYEPMNNCLLQFTGLNTAAQEITQTVQQSATAKVESILGPLLAIFLVIVVVIGGVYFGGVKMLTNWKFWLVIILIVLLYFALAFWRGWFPFERSGS